MNNAGAGARRHDGVLEKWKISPTTNAKNNCAAGGTTTGRGSSAAWRSASRSWAELQKRRPGSPYADQADLALARAAVERREFDEAARLLRAVAERSGDAELRLVAKTRLARVLVEQGKHDEALALLDVSQSGAFAALVHETRGDAFAAKGDLAQARTEYDAAIKASTPESGIDSTFVELKRDALVPAAPAPAADAPAAAPPAAEAPAQ